MLTRVLLRFFFFCGLAAPLCAFALGVGQLEVRSALDQIFEAELPLIINNPAELTGLSVQIPRQEDFDRVGVERLELLSKLRFTVQAPPGGRSVVRITSVEPIREPNFNLLLELVWPRGRLIREFPVQLDPELYANRRLPPPPVPIEAPPPPVMAPPPVAAAPAGLQLPPAPPVSFEGATFYGPVRPGETLMAIASRVRPSTAISVPQMMAILVAGNPAAFINGNPNALRAGATLRVPTPQALGLAASPPLAAAPPAVAPGAAPAPADLTTPAPPVVPAPESAVPPVAAEPGALPPTAVTPPLPVTPPVVVVPAPEPSPAVEAGSVLPVQPPAEPLREIVPQAAIPQPETPPVTAGPEAAAPPPAAVAPEAAAPPPAAAAPPPLPPAETEPGWMSNPVVWIAMALIALAIAAVILLPLLRRPARPRPTVVRETAALEPPETAPAEVETPDVVTTRTQVREPSLRPQPARVAAAAPTAAAPSPGPVAAPTPRPLRELLQDFEFGLGGGTLPAAGVGLQGGAPESGFKAPLLETEPPTAPATRRSAESPADASAKPAEPKKESPAPSSLELPPELRLEGLDFDFGGIELGQAARPQPSELPPLEMKPAGPGGRKPFELPPLKLSIVEPATEPPSVAPPPAPADSGKDLKFEFTDITQELSKYDTQQESLKLDEALQNLGGDTLKLGTRERDVRTTTALGGMDATDYVETKLDLASAYLDMGDQVGARSLLEEVLQEGNATQKERAEELLKKLG